MIFCERYIKQILLSFLVVFIPFILFKDLDIAISRLFYTEQSGFFMQNRSLVKLIHYIDTNLVSYLIIILFLTLLALSIRYRSLYLIYSISYLLFVYCTSIFLTHHVLKDFFNRTRPYMILEFGGRYIYEPPFTIGKQCLHHCSFPSGHSALGFSSIAFAFIVKNKKYQKILMIYGLTLGIIFSLTRIAQGAHFISDVLASAYIVFLISYYSRLALEKICT